MTKLAENLSECKVMVEPTDEPWAHLHRSQKRTDHTTVRLKRIWWTYAVACLTTDLHVYGLLAWRARKSSMAKHALAMYPLACYCSDTWQDISSRWIWKGISLLCAVVDVCPECRVQHLQNNCQVLHAGGLPHNPHLIPGDRGKRHPEKWVSESYLFS